MSDPIRDVTRAICTAGDFPQRSDCCGECSDMVRKAEAAARATLAALLEGPAPRPGTVAEQQACTPMLWFSRRVAAFARENGIELPAGGPQEPPGHDSARGTALGGPGPESTPDGPLPAYRTPDGYAL
jgi:hypothetical protein